MSDDASRHDSGIGRVTEEIRRIVAEGGVVDSRALARRFGLPWSEVERCAKAVRAMAAAAPPAAAEHEADPPLPPLPADYELLGELGRGGMAVVYRARQKSLGRIVAVKVLRPGELVFGALQKRFVQEARSLARLRHPHIVAIHEVGEAGANVFFSMDLVDGESLATLVARGEMTPTRAVKILRQVASAIAYSHGSGLVHRDLKPGNILVDRAGDAFVVDFGLARDMAVKGDLTGTGQLLGTPAYMSPEQARGDADRIGEATDVYALGAVLYECLTGRPPFECASLVETVRAVVHDEPVAPRKLDPKVPHDLEIICLKAMAKEPERRYANAQALLEDLERFAEGREIRARPPSAGYRVGRFARRHRVPLAAAAATAAVVVAAVVLFVVPAVRDDPKQWLAAAQASYERKDYDYAAKLAADAIERHRGDDAAGTDLRIVWGRARAKSAEAMLGAARFAEAGELARTTRDEVVLAEARESEHGFRTEQVDLGQLRAALDWIRIQAIAGTGDAAAIPKFLAESRRLGGWGGSLGAPLILDRAAPSFLDAASVSHAAAATLVAETLASPEPSGSAARAFRPDWLRDNADRAVAPVVALLRAVPGMSARDAAAGARLHETVARFLEDLAAWRPDESTRELAALAGDTSAPPAARACAAELLAAFDDVAVPGGAAAADGRAAFAAAAGVAPDASAADVLRFLLTTPGDEERADPRRVAAHRMLRLVAPAGARRPAWAYGRNVAGHAVLREPPAVVQAWCESLGFRDPARYRVRLASFLVTAGRTPLVPLWQETHEVGVGETVHVAHDGAVAGSDARRSYAWLVSRHDPGPGSQWMELLPPLELTWHDEADVSIAHRPGGLALEWPQRSTSLWLEGCSASSGAGIGGARRGTTLWMGTNLRAATGAGEEWYAAASVTLVAFEPVSADAAPWDFARWRDVVPDATTQALAAVTTDEPPQPAFPAVALPATLLAAIGVLLFLATRPPRNDARRLVPASLALTIALIATSLRVIVGGVDVRFELAGVLLAAAAAHLLADHARGSLPARPLLATIAFVLSVALVAVHPLVALAWWIGIAGLNMIPMGGPGSSAADAPRGGAKPWQVLVIVVWFLFGLVALLAALSTKPAAPSPVAPWTISAPTLWTVWTMLVAAGVVLRARDIARAAAAA